MSKTIGRVAIRKECREIHGIEAAFDVACERLKRTYLMFAKSEINKDRIWRIELKQQHNGKTI